MILHPESPSSGSHDGFVLARDAVARAQSTLAEKYWLIRQPDHARLSGELVQQLTIPGAPALSDDIVRGISLHDEGWTEFDSGSRKLQATPAEYSGEAVALNEEGKPLSFFEISPGDFLQAWRGSIENAEAVAPIAGLIVSGHFYRLAKLGLNIRHYSRDDAQLVRAFVLEEQRRQERLSKLQKRTPEEIGYWTDVLRFCDLLSLYLCCGSQENVEFPEPIGPHRETIRLTVEDGVRTLSPPIFKRESEFALQAQTFPAGGSSKLSWKLR